MRQFSNAQFLDSPEFPFACKWHEHAAGQISAEHSHEFIELVYVGDGEAIHHYQGNAYSISKGDVFVVGAEAVHSYEVSAERPLRICNVMFRKELLASELTIMSQVTPFVHFFYLEPFLRESEPFQPHLYLPVDECVVFEGYLQGLCKELSEKRLGYQIKVKAMMIDLFIYLSRCYAEQGSQAFSERSPDEETINQICEFIQCHYAENFTVEQICQLCKMSKTKFSVLFKRHTGMTFIDYRNFHRIEIGKRLLGSSDAPIGEVAQRLGFEDISFFNRIFKRYAGMPPRHYRKEHAR